MPKVVVTGPDSVSREYVIDRELTLGRHASNEIQIAEEKASRRHCRFRPNNGAVIVEDLDSSNGTKVNGRKIAQQALKHGDTIAIGQFTITFQDEANRFDRTVVLPEISIADVERARSVQARPAPPPALDSDDRTIPEMPFKPLDEAQWAADRAPRKHEHDPKAVLRYVALGLAGIVALALLLKFRPTSRPVADNRTLPAPVDPPAPTPDPVAGQNPPPLPPPPPPVRINPPTIPPKDPTILPPPRIPPRTPAPAANVDFTAELTRVLGERDRALGSGNFAGARAALNAFIAACGDTAVADRARQELASTEQVVEAALEGQLNEGRQAAASRKYRLALQICSRLNALDPQGRFGTEARSILTKIDESSEPRYKEVEGKVAALLRMGQLEKAGQALESAVDELGGTRWAEPVSSQQLQVLMARALIRKLEEAREKLAAGGKTIALALPSRKLKGTLVRIAGTGAEMRAGGVALNISFRDISPLDFEALQKTLGAAGGTGDKSDTALEEAYFWQLHGREQMAQAALERALQNPDRAALAVRLVNLLPGQQNLRLYDFSKWQHQNDWDALSGSWSTVNDRYVLESKEGGDTALRVSESAALSARNLRASFDFELLDAEPGAYFAFEFGTELRAVSAIFSQDSITLHANLDGAASQKQEWKLAAAHVDVVFNPENVDVSVNGTKVVSLSVPGLGELRGTVLFRVRDASAGIDNVVLRNATGQ